MLPNQLADDRDAFINPVDSLPTAYALSGISKLGHDAVHHGPSTVGKDRQSTMPRRLRAAWSRLCSGPTTRSGAAWLEEVFRWLLLFRVQQAGLQAADYDPFLSAPDTCRRSPPH